MEIESWEESLQIRSVLADDFTCIFDRLHLPLFNFLQVIGGPRVGGQKHSPRG